MSAKLRLLCLCVLPLLVSACNRPLVTADPPLPTSKPVDTGPLDAKATLTIVRTTSLMIGSFTITGAIPLFFGTSEDEQPGPIHVFGTGTGTASLDSGAQGTSLRGARPATTSPPSGLRSLRRKAGSSSGLTAASSRWTSRRPCCCPVW